MFIFFNIMIVITSLSMMASHTATHLATQLCLDLEVLDMEGQNRISTNDREPASKG